ARPALPLPGEGRSGRERMDGARPPAGVPPPGRGARSLRPPAAPPPPAARPHARRPGRYPLSARGEPLGPGPRELPLPALHLSTHRGAGDASPPGRRPTARRVAEPLHALPVHLLPPEPRARHPPVRLPVLLRPRRFPRLRAGDGGHVPALSPARGAARGAPLLRVPVRLDGGRFRRARPSCLAVLRHHGDRRTGTEQLRAVAV